MRIIVSSNNFLLCAIDAQSIDRLFDMASPAWYRGHLWLETTRISAVSWSNTLILLEQSAESCRAFFATRPFRKIARAGGWTSEIGGTTEHVPTAESLSFLSFYPRGKREMKSFLATVLLLSWFWKYLNCLLLVQLVHWII